jgi:1-aminocyclopropane-1-carboxylate deaminase/D-cysteine desulfhydrase-like pyridoxal-dependent ACC family enzyme
LLFFSPIHKLEKISRLYKCDIYILRDDLTGFALGGNKPRKLDYLIGDALAAKADTLITQKATSFSRNAAAAASAQSLELHVVIPGSPADHNQLSRDFFHKYETSLYYTAEYGATLQECYSNILEELRQKGKSIYELHPGGSDCIGTLGYLRAFQEIIDFSERTNTHFSHIMHASGSAGTQAGLLLGQHISQYDVQLTGISVLLNAEAQAERIRKLAHSTADMLNIDISNCIINVDDRFIGPGYEIPSEEGRKAVREFAQMEGILLDQVYSGKASAGLLHYAENNLFTGNVLFIHTGGNAGLFY